MKQTRVAKRFSRPRLHLGFAFGLIVTLVGCNSQNPSVLPTSSASNQNPSAPPTSIELKVGVLAAQSGPAAELGAGFGHAAQLAVDLLQDAITEADLASTYSISIAFADDQCLSTAAVEAATKLVSIDNVDVVIGSPCSGATIPAAQSVTIPKKIPMFTAGTAPSISSLNSERLVFRTVPSDAWTGLALAQAVGLSFGKTATLNVGAINNAFGVGLLETFEASWTENGGAVNQKVIWNPTGSTFDTEAQQLVSGDPDGWVLITQIVDWPKLEPALVRTGDWDPFRTWGAADFYCDHLGFPAGVSAVETNIEGGQGIEFLHSLWTDDAPTYRGTLDPEAFDNVIIAFLAAAQAGSAEELGSEVNNVVSPGNGKTSYTPDKLADALRAVAAGEAITYAGATGVTGFDSNGDPSTAAFVSAQLTDNEGGCKETGEFTFNP